MKNFVLIVLTLLLINTSAFASSKCINLAESMYNKRFTLFNVLNLTCDQQKCKDTIDGKYSKEVDPYVEKLKQETFVLENMKKFGTSQSALKKQEKIIKNIEKDIQKIDLKYEKEFRSVLNSEQKTKLRTIIKMQKRELNYCSKQKAFYQRDPKLRPFGEKMYYNEEVLCPVHKKWHIFGFKHKSE